MAYVPGGKSAAVVSADYTIAELCVAPGGTGDGRRTSPMGSLAAAVDKARSSGIRTVKLASGEFQANLELSVPLAVSGGWKADFSAASGKPTVLRGGSVDTATNKKAPGYALRVAGTAVDATARLERLVFRGPEASYSAGLVVADGARPTVVSCEAYGGSGSYGYGASVLSGANPSFQFCRLDGGEGATSTGLSVDGAKATVSSCFLLAGNGTVTGYGLSATDAGVKAYSSVLAAGKANVGYGAAFYTSKDSALVSCTVSGGEGKEATGVFISDSDPALENCIVSASGSAKSYGLYTNYGRSAPSRLASTLFLGCSTALLYAADTKTAYVSVDAGGGLAAEDGRILSSPKPDACARGDFSLGPAPGFAVPAGTALPAGKPSSGPAATDLKGKARTEPWSVGAYEL